MQEAPCHRHPRGAGRNRKAYSRGVRQYWFGAPSREYHRLQAACLTRPAFGNIVN